jgi:hypothetical protein
MKKVTFYSDEELWKKFSASILEKEGTTRRISEKLQSLIKNFLLEDFFHEIFKQFKINTSSFISSEEVKRNRPIVEGSSAEIVREGRDSR